MSLNDEAHFISLQPGLEYDKPSTVSFVVSMAPFERQLLQSTAERWRLNSQPSDSQEWEKRLLTYLFNHWDITYQIQALLRDTLTDRERFPDRAAAFNAALESFGKYSGNDSRRFRAEQLRLHNQNFLEELADLNFSVVRFTPHRDDVDFWQILVAMFKHLPREMACWTDIECRTCMLGEMPSWWKCWAFEVYEIWRIDRMFNLRCYREDNVEWLVARYLDSPDFNALLRAAMRAGLDKFIQRQSERPGLVDVPLEIMQNKGGKKRNYPDDNSSGETSTIEISVDELQEKILLNNPDMEFSIVQSDGSADITKKTGSVSELLGALKEIIEENAESKLKQGSIDVGPWLPKEVFSTGEQTAPGLSLGHLCDTILLLRFCVMVLNPNQLTSQDLDALALDITSLELCDPEVRYEPGSYLEIIPWDKLQHIPGHTLSYHAFRQFPALASEIPMEMKLWHANGERIYTYQFFAEEEVYQAHLLHKSCSDGYKNPENDNAVIFYAVPLGKTQFQCDYKTYWKFWNDCAITIDPESKECYLLQTLPGIRFRNIYIAHGEVAALKYFRKEADLIIARAIPEQSVNLKDLLGPHYTPESEHLLQVLPFTEIVDVDPIPIGTGRYGAVFAAKWNRPMSLTWRRPSSVSVVLKRARVELTEKERLAKFLSELQVTYSALVGDPAGLIGFFGVTLPPKTLFPSEAREPLFLVFERATEGTLLSFLNRSRRQNDWSFIIRAFDAIGNGLLHLHSHGLFHRDIHHHNILVTKRHYPYELESEGCFEYKAVLCDLGEGKVAVGESATVTGPPHGARNYRAPEIDKGNPYTAKADVYSYGVVGLEILNNARNTPSQEIPIQLCEVFLMCTSKSPAERPEIKEVVRRLEQMHDDLEDGKLEYTKIENFWAMSNSNKTSTEPHAGSTPEPYKFSD